MPSPRELRPLEIVTPSGALLSDAEQPGHWYVAKVKPGLENQVTEVLAHRQVDTFFPRIPTRPRIGKGGRLSEPLFPGYIFARLDLGTNQWVEARSAPGVQHFLPTGATPMAVATEMIAEIRNRCHIQLETGWAPTFRTGDWVVIEHGPFRGLEGVFDGTLSSKGRVRVLLELVNRQTPVELDGHAIRSVPRRLRPSRGMERSA
ncbi:MAG: transcription termination/antitermination protein NusG [Chloroflexota bacterium]